MFYTEEELDYIEQAKKNKTYILLASQGQGACFLGEFPTLNRLLTYYDSLTLGDAAYSYIDPKGNQQAVPMTEEQQKRHKFGWMFNNSTAEYVQNQMHKYYNLDKALQLAYDYKLTSKKFDQRDVRFILGLLYILDRNDGRMPTL